MPINLKDFVLNKMRVSGPYQPTIIKLLLQNKGEASLLQIATELAKSDPDSINYYIDKLKIYPKAVLAKHKIATIKNGTFHFEEVSFSSDEEREIILACDEKLSEYYSKNLQEEENSGWGRLRIRLLEAHPYCSLCGSKPSKTNGIELDIDHIKPSSKGGSNEESNLQVLCHRCNRAKGNYLLKSSKEIHDTHLNKAAGCLFCEIDNSRKIGENEFVYIIKDKYEVTKDHSLIIPKRHVKDALELMDAEMVSIHHEAKNVTSLLKNEDKSILGFNLGFNCGESAGQSIMHAHFHIIPRRKGDVLDPFGGIRNVIPGKGRY